MYMKMRSAISALLFTVVLASCGIGEAYHGYKLNPAYRYDILGRYDAKFQFDPDRLPIPGKTTLKDLDRMYPGGPEFRWSFSPPLIKEIDGKQIGVDKIILYAQYHVKESHLDEFGGNHAYERVLMEELTLMIFLERGIVNKYYIRHMMRPYETATNKQMQPDKWNTVTSRTKYDTLSWPGYDEDMGVYWKQRGDLKQNHAYALSPFEKKEKWMKASDPTPKEAEAFHKRFKYQIWR